VHELGGRLAPVASCCVLMQVVAMKQMLQDYQHANWSRDSGGTVGAGKGVSAGRAGSGGGYAPWLHPHECERMAARVASLRREVERWAGAGASMFRGSARLIGMLCGDGAAVLCLVVRCMAMLAE
jgi:hypothetical protein